MKRKDEKVMSEKFNVADIFGENVFNDTVMKERLPKNVYKNLKLAIAGVQELNITDADVIANAMKNWAIEKGATHYTHWFQPLTGTTAEKHDSFISAPNENGKVLMEFSGKELIKGEPDASSFPSGGLRATFEARGYTAWDCTSPAFVREGAQGATLCIPTAFCSYTGEALDQKTPLLRSMDAVNEQALRILKLFGNTTSKKVTPSVGAEQEYFIVDREKYLQRKDLIFSGRTLFGAMPPKGQELDDHYFGSIRERIAAFMKDINEELWKLGVSAKTQHNEVAPAQHELAPIYAQCNIATDNNQLMMEVMKKVAYRHGLVCLLHEKPFAGVNGSGKHNNWSITTDDGINLLEPGKTPHENIQFLLVLGAVMKAVDKHAATSSIQKGKLKTGASTLPDLNKDATDRNRTSPFAFTGNKFEFRMVGSSDSIAPANVVLNTIVAESFKEIADQLDGVENFGYSDAWVEEAERRGLPNIKSMVDAIPALTTPKAVKLFESFGVFTEAELKSRAEIKYEAYAKAINIEAKTMIDMAGKQIIPSVISYTTELANSVLTVKEAGADASVQADLLAEVSGYLKDMKAAYTKLIDVTAKAADVTDITEQAKYFRDEVKTTMDELRAPADKLEMIVDKEFWPFPSYGDLLFEV